MLANGVGVSVKEGKGTKEVEFRRGAGSEGKRPQNMKPPPGAGRWDVKKKENRKERKSIR
jgi:hypothetical protein